MYCGYIHYDLLSSTVAIPVVAVRESPTRGVSCRGQQRIALGLGERQLSVQRAHLCLDRCTTGKETRKSFSVGARRARTCCAWPSE